MSRHSLAPRRLWQWAPVLFVMMSASAPAQIESDTLSDEQREICNQLVEQVVQTRGLSLHHPIAMTVMTVDELRGLLQREMESQLSASIVEGQTIALATVGLVPPGHDIMGNFEALLTEQVAGLYDDTEKELAMMEWINLHSTTARILIAHEITHALQDQNFDLLSSPIHNIENDDRALAALTILEGDAMIAMSEYAVATGGLGGYLMEVPQLLSLDQNALLSTPPYLQQMLVFPYLAGQSFLTRVRIRGGNTAVNALFVDFPESTEQILHPEISTAMTDFADRPTRVDLDPAEWGMPEQWEHVTDNTWGEFTVRQIFQSGPTTRTSSIIAAGWDGDRWGVWRDPETGEGALLWSTVWDSENDAIEFEEGMDAMWDQFPLAEVIDPEGNLVFESPQNAMVRNGATVHVAVWSGVNDVTLTPPVSEIELIP